MTRGAELYDLFMCLRFDRKRAQSIGLWTLICRMAWFFRDEDRRIRGGRRSWRNPSAVMADRPFLRATILHRRRA